MRLRKKKTLLDQASEYVDSLRPQVEAAVSQARDAVEDFLEDTARPALNDAREKAGPKLAEARGRAADYAEEARKKATPVVVSGAALAAERAAAAKDLADAKMAQLRGEEPEKKGGKLKKLALFALVAGAVGFVAKRLQGGTGSDNWQSSYVPTPAATPASPATAGAAGAAGAASTPQTEDDPGGASPDEAIADAAEGAHAATTPDDPAEVISVDDSQKP